MFEAEDQYIVHFLCEDYDVDIDHELDSIRFHRSRVNLVNKVEPIGIDGIIKINSLIEPKVYTPFNTQTAAITHDGKTCRIDLPDQCAYAILTFKK